MAFYSKSVVYKARELRKKGISTAEISKGLLIPKNAVLRWCFDIPSQDPRHLKSVQVKDKIKKKGEILLNKFVINRNSAKIFTALIYWCEGFRYPSCNCIGFSNSDSNLARTFLKLFRLGFNPKEEKLRVHLQLHANHNREEMISFWSNLLKIPERQFHIPTITKPRNKMKRIDYKGTCTIKYFDFTLYAELVGIYEAFFKKILK